MIRDPEEAVVMHIPVGRRVWITRRVILENIPADLRNGCLRLMLKGEYHIACL
jgi:hypothetical protein